jgi:hypothetical protein
MRLDRRSRRVLRAFSCKGWIIIGGRAFRLDALPTGNFIALAAF